METITVTEDAVREFVKEALYSMHLGDLTTPDPEQETPVNVNPVVDQSAAETDPMNTHFVPQNKPELDVAFRNLIKDVPVEKVPGIYKIVTKAIELDNDKTEEDEQMKKASQGGTSKIKEAIRNEIRKVLSEISPSHFDYGFSGYEYGTEDDGDKPKGKKINVVGDVGGSTFEEIAQELGFSVAGAKQAVDKAILKMRFLMKMDPEEREIMILNAMNDYIKMLTRSGELTPADIQLLKDHPDMVRELDGFREFLANVIRRARKGLNKLEDPLGDEAGDEIPGEAAPDDAGVPSVEPVAHAPRGPQEPSAKAPKGPKAAYKIYGRNGPTPVHTRIKGRVFRPTQASQFKNGDLAGVGFDDDDTISVKNSETGHTQKWKGEAFTRFIDKIISEGKLLKN
jgi:hypothetical protein